MKKRIVLIITFILLFATSCSRGTSDALKFKDEYESLNGTQTTSGKDYRTVTISKSNPMVYKTASDIVSMVNDKETFVVYFGFNSCPWCRSVLPTLLDVASDLKVDTIYYVDVKEIRDVLTINEDGEIVTTKEGDSGYMTLLELFSDVLADYSLSDSDGNAVETNEKRIYAPNVVSVVNGKATMMTTGISEKEDDPYMELTDEMIEETYDKFSTVLKEIINLNCSKDKKC